jgi:hypothetical protein
MTPFTRQPPPPTGAKITATKRDDPERVHAAEHEQNFAALDACDAALDQIAQMKIQHASKAGALFLRAKVFKRHVSSRFYKAVRRYQIRMTEWATLSRRS